MVQPGPAITPRDTVHPGPAMTPRETVQPGPAMTPREMVQPGPAMTPREMVQPGPAMTPAILILEFVGGLEKTWRGLFSFERVLEERLKDLDAWWDGERLEGRKKHCFICGLDSRGIGWSCEMGSAWKEGRKKRCSPLWIVIVLLESGPRIPCYYCAWCEGHRWQGRG